MKKGEKRGPYTKRADTKKKSKPSAASTEMLAAFMARGNSIDAPHDDEHDDGAPAAAVAPLVPLERDDKAKVRCNVGGESRLPADTRGLFALDHDRSTQRVSPRR